MGSRTSRSSSSSWHQVIIASAAAAATRLYRAALFANTRCAREVGRWREGEREGRVGYSDSQRSFNPRHFLQRSMLFPSAEFARSKLPFDEGICNSGGGSGERAVCFEGEAAIIASCHPSLSLLPSFQNSVSGRPKVCHVRHRSKVDGLTRRATRPAAAPPLWPRPPREIVVVALTQFVIPDSA